MKKYDGLIWAILFMVFGVLQYNDPDSGIWMLIYGAAAVLSLLAYLGKSKSWLYWVMFVASLIGAIALWPAQYEGLTLKDGYSPAIEEARESLGLAVCALGMLWLAFRR